MPEHQKPQSDEEFQSGEMSEEDLEQVTAASSDYHVTLSNNSNDQENSQIEIFQKPAAT